MPARFLFAHRSSYSVANRQNEPADLVGEGAETVEPILDSFGGYSTDNLSNFYFPYIIVLLMIFRDEVGVINVKTNLTTQQSLDVFVSRKTMFTAVSTSSLGAAFGTTSTLRLVILTTNIRNDLTSRHA